jgi:hypothetical protein
LARRTPERYLFLLDEEASPMSISAIHLPWLDPQEPQPPPAPDAGGIAEEILGFAILRSKAAHADLGDVVALIGLEAVAMLVAYGRASSLKEALDALAASAPVRTLLLREANGTGAPAPPLSFTRFALAPGACRAH